MLSENMGSPLQPFSSSHTNSSSLSSSQDTILPNNCHSTKSDASSTTAAFSGCQKTVSATSLIDSDDDMLLRAFDKKKNNRNKLLNESSDEDDNKPIGKLSGLTNNINGATSNLSQNIPNNNNNVKQINDISNKQINNIKPNNNNINKINKTVDKSAPTTNSAASKLDGNKKKINKRKRVPSTSQTSDASESGDSSVSDSNSSSDSGSSSSSSSSSSEDSDDELVISKKKKENIQKNKNVKENDVQKIKKKTAGMKQPKFYDAKNVEKNYKTKKLKTKNDIQESTDEENNRVEMGFFNQASRSTKSKLVAQLLCRWWYAFPDWPPKDYDYQSKLTKRKLKWVTLEEWEDAEDVDENGFTKVYQISAFPGVFRDPSGNAIDLRPHESCPSYANFMKKSDYELLQKLSVAYVNQLKMLTQSPYDETRLRRKLQMELDEINKELLRQQRRSAFIKKAD